MYTEVKPSVDLSYSKGKHQRVPSQDQWKDHCRLTFLPSISAAKNCTPTLVKTRKVNCPFISEFEEKEDLPKSSPAPRSPVLPEETSPKFPQAQTGQHRLTGNRATLDKCHTMQTGTPTNQKQGKSKLGKWRTGQVQTG
mgnify:CR=1 FL=1